MNIRGQESSKSCLACQIALHLKSQRPLLIKSAITCSCEASAKTSHQFDQLQGRVSHVISHFQIIELIVTGFRSERKVDFLADIFYAFVDSLDKEYFEMGMRSGEWSCMRPEVLNSGKGPPGLVLIDWLYS